MAAAGIIGRVSRYRLQRIASQRRHRCSRDRVVLAVVLVFVVPVPAQTSVIDASTA